jgi:protein involved in polysaccharide export with SLBB domain
MDIDSRYGIPPRRGIGLLVLGLLWACLAAPSAAQVQPTRPAPPASPSEMSGAKPEPFAIGNQLPTLTPIGDYVVGPQDVLTITVYGQNDLNGQFRVDADGTFTFPLVGRVTAGQLTVRQLEEEMARLLKEFVKAPQVSVTVGQYKSRRLFIVGEVRSPGAYVLTGNMSLIEAIALAGSALPTSSGEALIVRGGANGATQAAPMPPRGDKLAGGVTDRGAANRIDVERIENGTKLRVRVRLDELVRGGDTLIIPAKFF